MSDNTSGAPNPESADQDATASPSAYPPPAAYPPAAPAPPAAPQAGAYPPPAQPEAAPAYGAPPAYGTPPTYGAPAYGATPAYGAAGYGAANKTNTLAIVSLVASIASFVIVPFIGSVVGVITGHMALGQIKRTGEDGRGLAMAGTIIGWVGLGLSILGFILIFALIIPLMASVQYTYS